MRRYYSVRSGKNAGAVQLTFDQLRTQFASAYDHFNRADYFQEYFGYWCVDSENVAGKLGTNIEGQFLRRLRKDDLWPVREKVAHYSEDDLFDVIEFLYDHISKPLEGHFHSYGGCGTHYYTFDRDAGRVEFRDELNDFLRDYGEGYELSVDGEILTVGQPGLATLEAAELPRFDPENVESRVASAVRKFRRYRSSSQDRRDAIRDLADVLEFLRPKLKVVLAVKDEADLFNIANNFAIRHHDEKQKGKYDKAIWYSWMFYFYLATIHAGLRMLTKAQKSV